MMFYSPRPLACLTTLLGVILYAGVPTRAFSSSVSIVDHGGADLTTIISDARSDLWSRAAASFEAGSLLTLTETLLIALAIVSAIAGILLHMYLRERARFNSAGRLIQAAEGGRDGVWDWDVPNNRAYVTARAYRVLGIDVRETGIDAPDEVFLSAVHPTWHERVRDELDTMLSRSKSGRFDIVFRAKNRDGQRSWVRMRGLARCDEDGNVVRLLGSVMDITKDKTAEARLRHEVFHDSLTALPNRAYLYSKLRKILERSRDKSTPFALFMLDLNRFKEVNDTLGHGVGDELLKTVAERISKTLGRNDLVARLGGDEFAVIIPSTAAPAAYAKAEAIGAALSATPVVLFEHSLSIEASVGIAMFPEHGDSVDALMQRADIAMYTAKRNKIPCTFYSASSNPNSLGQIEHESELRQAIERNSLELHYQPKMNLRDGTVSGVEALIRWSHPEWGTVKPQLIAEIAEKSGLIHTLTEWVIETAANQAAIWQRRGITLPIAVNLSVWNIQNPDIVSVVRSSLKQSRVPPSCLEFEITETAMIIDPERAHKTLSMLSDLGIRFSVDDFGTGFSSLSYLKRLPVQVVKIDRSFVRDMVHDLADRSIVRSTIDMAHNLGLISVAEGVENEEMLRLLNAMNCNEAQGYLFSRALPATDITTWLRQSPWSAGKRLLSIRNDCAGNEEFTVSGDTRTRSPERVVQFPGATRSAKSRKGRLGKV